MPRTMALWQTRAVSEAKQLYNAVVVINVIKSEVVTKHHLTQLDAADDTFQLCDRVSVWEFIKTVYQVE
jgi:hypothetical protein